MCIRDSCTPTHCHSTPVMDRLMHSHLFLGRTPHRKNSDTMTRATRAFTYTRSIATGASPTHTIHTTRKYEWPTVGRTHTIFRLQTRIRRKDGTESFGGFVLTAALDLVPGILIAVPPSPHIDVFRVCLFNGFLCCGLCVLV